MLDAMHAYMPKGSMCNAIEYRVINPLFCNNEILVFRHRYPHNSRECLPICLNDLASDPTVSMESRELEELPGQITHESATRRNVTDTNLSRRSGVEARVLFWTENENGVVGTVLFATLIKEGRPSWELDPEMGYILPVGSIWPMDRKRIGSIDYSLTRDLVESDKSIAEPETFDSLGRPISRRLSQSPRAWPSRHPWQQDDSDVAALELEHGIRKQYATRLEESRNLLGQLITEDYDHPE